MLITTLALVAAFLGPARTPSHTPKWLDLNLVGHSLSKSEEVFLQDRKTGFFLIHTYECDGGINDLILTRDHKLTEGASNEVVSDGNEHEVDKPILKSFRKLSSGKGVTIGDTPEQVTKRLGKPTKIQKSGSRKQFVDYVYRDSNYTEMYTFKKGVLIQIVFDHSSE